MKCQYGCNQQAKHYFKRVKKWCCSERFSKCPEQKKRNSERAKLAHKLGKYDKVIRGHPFTGKTVFEDKRIYSKYDGDPDKILRIYRSDEKPNFEVIRKYLFHCGIKKYECEDCGISKWRDLFIFLQPHHRNGNKLDNRKENLKVLCPNCHNQTDNFAGRKEEYFKGRDKYGCRTRIKK